MQHLAEKIGPIHLTKASGDTRKPLMKRGIRGVEVVRTGVTDMHLARWPGHRHVNLDDRRTC